MYVVGLSFDTVPSSASGAGFKGPPQSSQLIFAVLRGCGRHATFCD
jgi:hypothetical protein